jgi:hypothetical protein
MATIDRPRSGAFHGAASALDHAIESAIDGAPSHASGTTFVPADLAGSGHISAYRRLGPVSIVDADGNETRLPQDRFRQLAVALVIAGVVAWLLSRRPRVVS